MRDLPTTSRLIDRAIVRAHRVNVLGRPYHPYFLLNDLGFAASMLVVHLETRHSEHRWSSFVPFVVTYGAYSVFLFAKRAVTGSASRSLLLDTVLFLLPCYASIAWALALPMAFALDLLARAMSLKIAFCRIGCLLGGCCFGRPTPTGIHYPRAVFVAPVGRRRFAPGVDPRARVFPMQLLDAAANAALFLILICVRVPAGAALPIYFLGYSIFRFMSDLHGRSSARPRRLGLSEAQLIAIVLGVASMLAIAHAGMSQ